MLTHLKLVTNINTVIIKGHKTTYPSLSFPPHFPSLIHASTSRNVHDFIQRTEDERREKYLNSSETDISTVFELSFVVALGPADDLVEGSDHIILPKQANIALLFILGILGTPVVDYRLIIVEDGSDLVL